jgi:hypothetical protein
MPGSGTPTTRSWPRRRTFGARSTARTPGSAWGKRSRVELAPEYREGYLREILDRVDLAPLVAELPAGRASALVCVERDPEACHRSLVAERLTEQYGITVFDLLPEAEGF